MTRWWTVLALAAPLAAQNANGLRGAYHFVQMSVESASPGAALTSRNAGGTMTFDGAGAVRVAARVGVGLEETRAADSEGRYSETEDSLTIPDPLRAGASLVARFNADRSMLVASSPGGAATRHDLLVAVRAPDAANPAKLEGDYGGAYFLVRDNDPRGVSTAFVELLAERPEVFSRTRVNGHVGGIDDVNRENETPDSSWLLRADGAGTAIFANDSDVLSGERELLVSAGGAAVLGFSTRPGERDILVAVRRTQFASNPSLRGRFWMNEIGAENEYAFAPEKARFGSAAGSLRSQGDGRAVLAQSFASSGARTWVAAANTYLLSGDGTAHLAPRARFGSRNFALSESGTVLVGAQVAPSGELTLQHGIFVAVRGQEPQGAGPFLSPYGVGNATSSAEGPIAPGMLLALSGSGFGASADAVKVTIDGAAARVVSAADNRVVVVAPASFRGATAAVQVEVGGKQSAVVTVPVGTANPGLVTLNGFGHGQASVTRSNGAAVQEGDQLEEGETVVLLATGVGAGKPRVLVNGREATVDSVAASDTAGVSKVTVRIPEGAGAQGPVSVAISAGGAFSDMADLLVRPKR